MANLKEIPLNWFDLQAKKFFEYEQHFLKSLTQRIKNLICDVNQMYSQGLPTVTQKTVYMLTLHIIFLLWLIPTTKKIQWNNLYPATFTLSIALPLACWGCTELNISVISQLNGQDKNSRVSGYEANNFNAKILHPPKSIWGSISCHTRF